MKRTLFFTLSVFLFFSACNKNENEREFTEWSIPVNEVRDGGPGKDGIPSIDNPDFIKMEEVSFLDDSDLVVVLKYDEQVKIYPHPILDWHEIVNDEISDRKFALNYCPLTGTALAWDREINGTTTTFGVSGKLYNNNLILYDRATDSYWSQIGLDCVNGELLGQRAKTFPIVEMNWVSCKLAFPEAEVMSTNTGFSRNYNNYPYGDYRTNNSFLLFPNNPSDNRLPSKQRVLGVLEEDANKVYSITNFSSPNIIYDKVGNANVIVIGSAADKFIVAFYDDGSLDNFVVNLDNLPVLGTDTNGNQLDINGEIVAGPLSGQQLSQPESFIGYWFSFGAFYPGIEIF